MGGPGVLLALGGLLGCARGGPEPSAFEVEALLAAEPLDPKCFSRELHDVTCFWESPAPPEPAAFCLQFRLEQDPWRCCPLAAVRAPGNRSRFWCALPPDAAVAFVPLELRVLAAPLPPPPATPPPPLHQRTVYVEQIVLLGPPENVSAAAEGARGQLCVRWQPPPSPYLEPSLAYELQLRAPGLPPRTVPVPAGRRELRVGGLRGSSRYSARLRARPDGLSYGGFWSPWSAAGSADTPADVDPVTLGLSCLLALLLLLLGLLALLGHRRTLQEKLWPPVPGPEREFEGLFSTYGGNFQLWLCQGVGAPWAPPVVDLEAEELPSTVEEVGPPPAGKAPPPEGAPPATGPPTSPSPASSFEYTLFDPGSALLCPPSAPPAPPSTPYANLAPPKGDGPKWAPPDGDGEPPTPAPPYVLCS